MVLTIVAWVLFLFTVGGSGFVALRPFPLFRLERVAVGVVVGATLLPFGLFLFNSVTHAEILDEGRAGFFFSVLVVVVIFALLFWELFSKRTSKIITLKPAQPPLPPLHNLVRWLLLLSLVAFFYVVVEGVTKPIFGWDEFSYWLYAAKLLYLTGGASTALRHDLYSSYPLGFPYLVAWCDHFLGVTSISAAKWISPIVTLATLVALERALERSGVRSPYALLGCALTAWGSFMMLNYNWLAFGEMVFVDTYALAALYVAIWLRERRGEDLVLSCLLLGLTTFLRVDGTYIAVFTLVLLFISNIRNGFAASRRQWFSAFALAFIPAVAWYAFRFVNHMNSGWTKRIFAATVTARLHSPVLPALLHSMWATVGNLGQYPIDLLLLLLVVTWPFSRRRDVFFLTALSIAQLAYLFVTYLTVFTTYEAMHASSLPRYMLRNDPLIAIAFALLISGVGKTAVSYRRQAGKRRNTSRIKVRHKAANGAMRRGHN